MRPAKKCQNLSKKIATWKQVAIKMFHVKTFFKMKINKKRFLIFLIYLSGCFANYAYCKYEFEQNFETAYFEDYRAFFVVYSLSSYLGVAATFVKWRVYSNV